MNDRELIQEELTRSILGAFFEVYNGLGDGYLEHLYIAAMELELTNTGFASLASSACESITKVMRSASNA